MYSEASSACCGLLSHRASPPLFPGSWREDRLSVWVGSENDESARSCNLRTRLGLISSAPQFGSRIKAGAFSPAAASSAQQQVSLSELLSLVWEDPSGGFGLGFPDWRLDRGHRRSEVVETGLLVHLQKKKKNTFLNCKMVNRGGKRYPARFS